jgi:hypothetical protein
MEKLNYKDLSVTFVSQIEPLNRIKIINFLESIHLEYEQAKTAHISHPWLDNDKHTHDTMHQAFNNILHLDGHTGPIERTIDKVLSQIELANADSKKFVCAIKYAIPAIEALGFINMNLAMQHREKIASILEVRKQHLTAIKANVPTNLQVF